MNRYDLLPHVQKTLTQSPTPSTSLTPTKPSYKLSIPNPFQTDSLRIEIVEPFDPKPQIRANELTFKRQLSNSSLKNPFSEDYLQSNNTEQAPLNASLMSPAAFDNALDSPSVMEIPSERHQNVLIFTTYNSYKERSKASETLDMIETPLTTEPDTTMAASPRKNLSYSIPENSDKSLDKRSSLSSHKKTSLRNSSTAKKSKKKHYERMLEEIMQREKENRDVSSQGDMQSTECPMTPTLGYKPFSFCSSSHRKKSKGASSRKGERDASPIESLEKIRANTEEVEKEREYLKVKVNQLRMMVKKEYEEIGKIEKNVKLMDHDMKSLNSKQKHTGKQGIDIKEHVVKIKDEVLKLLEEIDNNRKGLEGITEKIAAEKTQVETLKDKNNTLRRWLTDEIKERENQKGLGVHLKKSKQKAVVTHEGLERERQTYVRTLEDTFIENGERGV